MSRDALKQTNKFSKKESRAAYLFIAPQIIGLVVFILIPFVFAVVLSFCSWDLTSMPRFVGLQNFYNVFVFDGALFFKTLNNTLVFLVGIVPITMIISLSLALLANQRIKGLSFYKSAFFLPMVTSAVAIAMVWYWLFAPNFGLINHILGFFGISGPGWLSDPFLHETPGLN